MSTYIFTADSVTVAGRTFPARFDVAPSGDVVLFVTLPGKPEPVRVSFAPDHPDHAAALAAARQEQPAATAAPIRKPMRFHGFDSVQEYINACISSHFHTYVRTYTRRGPSDYGRHVPGVTLETLPYGDPIASIADDDPDTLRVVSIITDSPTARLCYNVFDAEYTAFYASGVDSPAELMAAWGFAEEAQEQPAETAAETVQPAAEIPEETPAAETVPQEDDPAPIRRPVPEKAFIGETIPGRGWRIFFDGEASRTRVIFDADPTAAARAALDKAGFYFSPNMQSFNKKLTHKAHRAALALAGELRALYA